MKTSLKVIVTLFVVGIISAGVWLSLDMDVYIIWNFLNQNIVSEAIGAFIFGLIVALLLHKYLKVHETKEIIKKISFHLKQELEENQNTAKSMKEKLRELKKNGVTILFPSLSFNTSILSAIFQGESLKVLPTQQSSLVIELFDYCNNANKTWEQLNQLLKEEFKKPWRLSISISDTDRMGQQMIKGHLISTLEEYLLPSIIQICDKLLFQLKDTTK